MVEENKHVPLIDRSEFLGAYQSLGASPSSWDPMSPGCTFAQLLPVHNLSAYSW